MADNIEDVNTLIANLNSQTEEDARRIKEDFEPVSSSEAPSAGETTPEPSPTAPAPEMPKEPYTAEKAKSTAMTWIKWLSSGMKWLFPMWYRSAILAKGDQQKMQAFMREQKSQGRNELEMEMAMAASAEMQPVKNRFDKYLEACESVKLSQEEMEYIAEPLSELIYKYRYLQLGPEWSLVMAVVVVMLPRFEPMIPDLGKIFATAGEKANQKAA